jgi:hypothetical protein
MLLREIQRFVENEHEYAKLLAHIRQEFPYKMPKTHVRWELLSAIATMMTGVDAQAAPDAGTYLHCRLWQQWVRQRSPLYCISTDLLRQFELTDTDNLPGLVPSDWVPPLNLFLLCFPNNAVVSPIGQPIHYMLVALMHPEIPGVIGSEHPRQISIALTDYGECVWVSGSGLGEGKLLHERNKLGSHPTDKREEAWLEQMISIGLQCSMAISYLPELIDSSESSSESPQRPGGRQPSNRPRILTPRWIGRDFRRSPSTNLTGTHASPTTHWRRGHWRQQPYGEGRSERRLAWIKPTLVGSS